MQEIIMKQVASRALLDIEDGGDIFHRNFPLIFDGLHRVLSQKTEFSSPPL
jgi:hypothetical protein